MSAEIDVAILTVDAEPPAGWGFIVLRSPPWIVRLHVIPVESSAIAGAMSIGNVAAWAGMSALKTIARVPMNPAMMCFVRVRSSEASRELPMSMKRYQCPSRKIVPLRADWTVIYAALKRSELPTTMTDDDAIAAAAIPGTMNPRIAIGIATRLYPKAQPRFCLIIRNVA